VKTELNFNQLVIIVVKDGINVIALYDTNEELKIVLKETHQYKSVHNLSKVINPTDCKAKHTWKNTSSRLFKLKTWENHNTKSELQFGREH